MRFSQLLYDSGPGEEVWDVATKVLAHSLGGFIFNGRVIRVESGDTADSLVEKYWERKTE